MYPTRRAPRRPRPVTNRRGTLAVVAVAATAVVTAVACTSPVEPTNRPSVPAGQSNGALDPDLLRPVGACVVNRLAAPSLTGLLQAAAAAGVKLTAGSCYRDLAGQIAVRESWCAREACQMAAKPGTSNHGWGKAVDFTTADEMTFDSPAYRWLASQAWIFGWNHPSWADPSGTAPEPWHWEWVGDGGTLYPGVTIGPQ